MNDSPGQMLAAFAASLRFEDIPHPVLRRAEDLMLDWLGSALAGRQARPVETLA
jgi:2-methylcitrate dehydratase PrpD